MNRVRKAQSVFAKLSQAEKVVTIGAILTIVSLFLPWYRDLDAWQKGEVFLGVTGPLSMIGLVILAGTGAVLVQMIGRALHKEVKLLKKIKNLTTYVAAENVLLFIVATSIYLDPKFGVNLTLKETSFGLFLCLVGSAIMWFGHYMKNHEPEKPELNVFEEVEKNIDRMHKDIMQEHQEIQEEMSAAEKEYRELHLQKEATEKNETLKMDI